MVTPDQHLDLSLVLEMATSEITGKCETAAQLAGWIRELDRISPKKWEIIVSSSGPPPPGVSYPGVHFHSFPGSGYYALKNHGANLARGEIVFFGDIDCRPGADFFTALLRHFDDPGQTGVGSRTFYDGNDLFTKIETVITFGYLHDHSPLFDSAHAMGHGIGMRRSLYEKDPFGPHTGRDGGDVYLTEFLRRDGRVLPKNRDLRIYHENITYSPWGTVERNLREMFGPLSGRDPENPPFLFLLARAWELTRVRWRRLREYGRFLGLTTAGRWAGNVQVLLYFQLNLLIIAVLVLRPDLTRRWARHQFGISSTE